MIVDFDLKEARFKVKAGSKCDMEEVKKVVAKTGRGTVGAVKSAPSN